MFHFKRQVFVIWIVEAQFLYTYLFFVSFVQNYFIGDTNYICMFQVPMYEKPSPSIFPSPSILLPT